MIEKFLFLNSFIVFINRGKKDKSLNLQNIIIPSVKKF